LHDMNEQQTELDQSKTSVLDAITNLSNQIGQEILCFINEFFNEIGRTLPF